MTIILSNLSGFLIFVVKWTLKISSHLSYVATPPCETLMSAKQVINDKLQRSAATYLRCGGVVNNQIKKGLLLWPHFLAHPVLLSYIQLSFDLSPPTVRLVIDLLTR